MRITGEELVELSRLRSRVKELEHELRKELWLHHGHSQLYGDDGEMQCSHADCRLGIGYDFKTPPIETVINHVANLRLIRAKAALDSGNTGEAPSVRRNRLLVKDHRASEQTSDAVPAQSGAPICKACGNKCCSEHNPRAQSGETLGTCSRVGHDGNVLHAQGRYCANWLPESGETPREQK
jgi:hypothetical protein